MLVIQVNPAKMSEPIKMPFCGSTCMIKMNHVLDGSTHGRHLVNITEQSMLGETGCCQPVTTITVAVYFYRHS